MQKMKFIITPLNTPLVHFNDEHQALRWAKIDNPQLVVQIKLSCRNPGTILKKFCDTLGYRLEVQRVDTSCVTTVLPTESLWIQVIGTSGE